jgi:2-iminobutanoate/2-iminopropanoate deaminase
MIAHPVCKLTLAIAAWLTMTACAGTSVAAEHLAGNERQKSRAFSPAVITDGGRTVWLAGQTTTTDLKGADITGNFDAQARTVFRLLEQTLARANGTLADIVTMTVFITDPRYGDRFVEIRREIFADGAYPASALITVSNFARPGILIEVQAVAVIGERN